MDFNFSDPLRKKEEKVIEKKDENKQLFNFESDAIQNAMTDANIIDNNKRDDILNFLKKNIKSPEDEAKALQIIENYKEKQTSDEKPVKTKKTFSNIDTKKQKKKKKIRLGKRKSALDYKNMKPLDDKENPPSSDDDFAPITVNEKIPKFNYTRIMIIASALAIVGIIMFSQMADTINPAFVILIWVFGMMCFLPLGVFIGWFFLDPYMRCKIYRRFRGRNYGIVNFMHKGGQRFETHIKNLDYDVVVNDGKMWILEKEGVFYINKDNQKVLHKKIDAEMIKTMPANIPCLFVDIESMTPIRFHSCDTKTNPQEAGAICLGYINNQIQKNASLKSKMSLFYIIILGILVLNIVLTFQLYTWLEELYTLVPSLKRQITNLGNLIAELSPPSSGLINVLDLFRGLL